MIRKTAKFVLLEEHTESFNKLKRELLSTKILGPYSEKDYLRLQVDASSHMAGAVLESCRITDDPNVEDNWLPLQYFWKTFPQSVLSKLDTCDTVTS